MTLTSTDTDWLASPVRFDNLSPFRLIRLLWGHRLYFALTGALALMLALAYIFWATTPIYKASATVVLEARKNTITNLGAVVSDLTQDEAVVNSEIEILRSRNLLFRVIDELDLTKYSEFNPQLQESSFWLALRQRLRSGDSLSVDEITPDIRRERAVAMLTRRIKVEGVPDSLVFRVSVKTGNPGLSVRIANTICRLYVADQKAAKLAASQEAQAWLLERVRELQHELINSETRLAQFAAETQLISERSLTVLLSNFKAQRDRLAQARTQATAAKASDPRQSGYAGTRVAALESSLPELKTAVSDQAQDLIRQRHMERDVQANEEVYAYFLTRYKETAAQEGLQHSESRVLSAAMFPIDPHSPDKPRILAFAVLMSIFATAAWILISTLSSSRVRCSRDLARFSGLPVLATLPKRQRRGWFGRTRADAAPDDQPIRNLRARLLAAAPGTACTTCTRLAILAPAPSPDQGPLVTALAGSLAALNRKVLVIRLQQCAAAEPGPWPPEPQQTAAGFDVIDIGAPDAAVSDRLAGAPWQQKLSDWGARYDHIVIDAPAILTSATALSLTLMADQAIVLARWNDTDSAALTDSLAALGEAAERVLGTVLTGVSVKGLRRLGLGNVPEARYLQAV